MGKVQSCDQANYLLKSMLDLCFAIVSSADGFPFLSFSREFESGKTKKKHDG